MRKRNMRYITRWLTLANSNTFTNKLGVKFLKLAFLLGVGCFGMLAQANMVYVANCGSNNVSVIDPNTNSVSTTVSVGICPRDIAVNLAGTRIYVANYKSNNVSVIDTGSNSVVATITVGSYPVGVTVNPSGTRVYVANSKSNNISVIDTATNSVVATVTGYYDKVVVNPDGTRFYVADVANGIDNVSVIDTSTYNLVATIPLIGNPIPFSMIINSAGTRVYVSNRIGNISEIDTNTNRVVATSKIMGEEPRSIAINSSGTRIYVTNQSDNNISVIDTTNFSANSTVAVGKFPWGIALNSAATIIYVVNGYDNTVSVIDASNNKVMTTIATKGQEPVGIAVAGLPARLKGISTRGYVGNTAENNMFAGLIISGSGSEKLLIRGLGQGLNSVGVATSLDARLEIKNLNSNTIVDSNNDWQTHSSASQLSQYAATPVSTRDAALVTSLNTGMYSIQVSPVSSPGVGLVEIFDKDLSSKNRLAGISTRGYVGNTPVEFMYAGISVQGNLKVLIRALGDGLRSRGVAGALDDAKITVRKGSSVIATNDSWSQDKSAMELQQKQQSPPSTSDAAMFIMLSEGDYTIEVSSARGGKGVALVEVYDMP